MGARQIRRQATPVRQSAKVPAVHRGGANRDVLGQSHVEGTAPVIVAAEPHVAKPCVARPDLRKHRISPHTLRHTTAMHLLQSGVEVNVIRS
jgi:integrase